MKTGPSCAALLARFVSWLNSRLEIVVTTIDACRRWCCGNPARNAAETLADSARASGVIFARNSENFMVIFSSELSQCRRITDQQRADKPTVSIGDDTAPRDGVIILYKTKLSNRKFRRVRYFELLQDCGV
jgi:hypothetical protein